MVRSGMRACGQSWSQCVRDPFARPSYGYPSDDLRWKGVYRQTLRDTSTFKFIHVALTCEKSRIVIAPSKLPMNTF
jgi:hypothetical protein